MSLNIFRNVSEANRLIELISYITFVVLKHYFRLCLKSFFYIIPIYVIYTVNVFWIYK